MTLRDYLLGVVAAEMPASFEPAALEAQAVAARTDTLYRLLVAKPHKEAACCVSPGCCKAYLSPEELRRRWGEDYERWSEKIAAAVDATDGEVLTWEGEPIFAAFHACSAGSTEASEDVWTAALPYLRSVPTLETEADVPAFRTETRFGAEELRTILLEKVPGAEAGEDPAAWLTGEKYSGAGRLRSVEAGGVTLSGCAFRMLLGLRSTAVTWELKDGVFIFTTLGYGHGVGLSQYGAEVMAKAGSSWEEILRHYYAGTELSGLEEVFRG
jgi:stage II sporulation protein D